MKEKLKETKKKNLILFGLVIALFAVSYINYSFFYDENKAAKKTSGNEPANAKLVNNTDENAIMNGDVAINSEFFTSYRLEREKTRSANIEALQEIVDNENSDEKMVKEAQSEILKFTSISEKELIVENLIKTKGFDDAIIMLHEGNANVVVLTDDLTAAKAAQIQDIVNKECNIDISKISVATGSETKEEQ